MYFRVYTLLANGVTRRIVYQAATADYARILEHKAMKNAQQVGYQILKIKATKDRP